MDQIKKHYTTEELETIQNFLEDYRSVKELSNDDKITLRQIQDDIFKLTIGF